MISKTRIPMGWIALSVLVACEREDRPSRNEPRPPNVILFLVDSLRADALGTYGNSIVETPAIDRFAREGAVFERAFATSSWTRPSVTSILTGLHPSAHGAETRNDRLSPALSYLPEIFREHGYRTGFLVTNPNIGAFFGYSRGVDDFLELYGRREEGRVSSQELVAPSDQTIGRAREWLDQVSEPFFLVVFVIDPHFPYDPPPAFDRYASSVAGDPRLARYYGEVAFVDDSFGRLMEHLRERGIAERTIALFTADHGEEFLEHDAVGHGKSLYEESLRVPLLLRWPGHIDAGQRIEMPVQLVDILPTVLGLARIPVPPSQQGRPLFRPSGEPEPPLFASLKLDGRDQWSVRAYPWKLILDRRSDRSLLFDLSSDPEEKQDLSRLNPGRVREIRGWLAERIEKESLRRAALQRGSAPAEISEGELSEKDREALRALGYIQ
jgi:arylsulfatase A-like enzyme